jgi:hypothetical protein
MGQGGTELAGDYKFYYESEKDNYKLGIGSFVHKRNISAVTRAKFVSDRMSYVILSGRWCDIIVLNVHALKGDKTDDMKGRFCEYLDHGIYQLIR